MEEERTYALTQTDHRQAPLSPASAGDPLPAAGGEDGVWEKGRLLRKVQLYVQAQGLGRPGGLQGVHHSSFMAEGVRHRAERR